MKLVTLNIADDVEQTFNNEAHKQGITLSQLILDAFSLYLEVRRRISSGERMVFEKPDGSSTVINFKY